MPSLDAIWAVTLAGLALSASPGPSMLYVLSRSIGQSRMAGFASSIGLALGGVVLAVISAMGLATIFQYSTTAFYLLSFIGGGYLCHLGIAMIREIDSTDLTVEKVEIESMFKIIYQGILVELLNPKTILFFMAFLPQFIDPTKSDITMQVLILGMLVPLTAIPSDIIVSIAGGKLAHDLASKPVASRVLTWIGGLILIGLGINILLQPFDLGF